MTTACGVAAGQIPTSLLMTCQIPALTWVNAGRQSNQLNSPRLYLFNQVQIFPIKVGVVQAWVYKNKVCH